MKNQTFLRRRLQEAHVSGLGLVVCEGSWGEELGAVSYGALELELMEWLLGPVGRTGGVELW